MRPAEHVYEELAKLKMMGCKSVFVYDDELVGASERQSGWLMGVCDQIGDLDLTWKCQGRVSSKLTLDVFESMYRAGCRAIMWGVESFRQPVLDAIRKGTTEDDIWHTLRLARKAGIGNWLFLMVGNYRETARDLAYTENRLGEAYQEGLVQWRQVTVCTPIPGTWYYAKGKEEGWLQEPPEGGMQMAQVYQSTPWLKARDIRYWKARLEGAT
jgi:radical SAM superfamily enzyme YgiQ (UPF0313 family)